MAALTIRDGLGRNLTPDEVDGNFLSLNTENASQQTAINAKAPLASPDFSGAPTAPTPPEDDSTQRIATTAWVMGQASDDLPEDNAGTASAGTSPKFARADHVHVGSAGGGAEVQDALTPASATKAPSVDAVVAALALKAETSAVNTAISSLTTEVNAKSPVLTFIGATQNGSTVTIDPAAVVGNPLDGNSLLVVASSGGFTAIGASPSIGTGTYAQLGGNGSTNTWNVRQRGRVTAAAGTGNFARMYTVPGVRFASDNNALYGFKLVMTFAPNDALTNAHIWCGVSQHNNLPAAGVNPSAYTGQRFGLQCAGDDTNRWYKLVFYNGTTLTVVKDLGSSFPCDGLETNPIQFEIESVGVASGSRVTKWKVTHLISGATDSGTLTGTGPSSNFETNFSMWRDSAGSATQAIIVSTGMGTGSLRAMVVGGGGTSEGGGTEDISETREVTASGPLLPTDVNCTIRANSSSAIELSLPSMATLGATDGKATITIYNKGTGVVTLAPQSGVPAITGSAPPGTQNTFVVITHIGDGWVYAA